jgi:hypothetical protein
VYENDTDFVEIEREGNVFSCTFHAQTDLCPFHLLFPPYCDVPQARSYFASTVQSMPALFLILLAVQILHF